MLRGQMKTMELCRRMRLRIGQRRLTNHFRCMHPHSAKQSCWAWSPLPHQQNLSPSASLDPILKNSCSSTLVARRHIPQSANRPVTLPLCAYLLLYFCLPGRILPLLYKTNAKGDFRLCCIFIVTECASAHVGSSCVSTISTKVDRPLNLTFATCRESARY